MIKLLSKKEKKELKKKLSYIDEEILSEIFEKYENIFKVNLEDKNLTIYYSNKPIFFEKDNIIFPTLNLIYDLGYIFLKEIRVDDGAVKYILKGADVFRPGITFFEENIQKGDIAVIEDPKERPIAIGISLVNFDEFKSMEKGRVVKNYHYLNDKIFKFSLEK